MELCIPTIVSIALGVLWVLFAYVADTVYTSPTKLMPQTASDWLAYLLISSTLHIVVQFLCMRGNVGTAWILGVFPFVFNLGVYMLYNLWTLSVTTDASGNIYVQ